MKNFKNYYNENKVNALFEHINEAEEMSDTQKNYADFMAFGMAKFGAESPADLSTEDKKEFFNWIKDNWDKEKGEPKDSKIKDKIEKAKKEGLIPSEPMNNKSEKEKEDAKEKEAEEKKKKFKELMN